LGASTFFWFSSVGTLGGAAITAIFLVGVWPQGLLSVDKALLTVVCSLGRILSVRWILVSTVRGIAGLGVLAPSEIAGTGSCVSASCWR